MRQQQQRFLGPPPRTQRGAALVFTAAFILAAVAALALAIDVGRLYAAQQRLQTAANAAALDAARYVGGCRDGDAQSQAQQAVERNYKDRSSDTVPTLTRFDTGVVTTQSDIRSLDTVSGNQRPSAVALTVTDDGFQPFFINLFGATDALRASAGAESKPQAQIGIGSTLVGINPNLLSQLLPISVGAAQQGDLANLSISLADLLGIDTGVATRQQLLETSLSGALSNIGDAVSGQVAAFVDQIAALLPADPTQASVLDILDIAGPVGSQVSVNAGAIVNAAAELAAIQRQSAISLPINLSAPLVGGAQVNLRLLEPPQITIGPPGIDPDGTPQDGFPAYYTQVESAQVGLEINLDLLDLDLGLVGSLNLLDLPLAVRGARATAGLRSLDCANSNRLFHSVSLDTQTEDLRVGVGHFEDTTGNGRLNFVPTTAKIADVKLLLLPVPTLVTVSADSRFGIGSQDVDFSPITDPDTDLPQYKPISSDPVDTAYVLNLLSGLDLHPNVAGLPVPVSDILDPIRSALSGPLTSLLAPLLDPMLDQLGVSLGTGEAQLLGLNTNQPQLFCMNSDNCFGQKNQ